MYGSKDRGIFWMKCSNTMPSHSPMIVLVSLRSCWLTTSTTKRSARPTPIARMLSMKNPTRLLTWNDDDLDENTEPTILIVVEDEGKKSTGTKSALFVYLGLGFPHCSLRLLLHSTCVRLGLPCGSLYMISGSLSMNGSRLYASVGVNWDIADKPLP